MATALRQYKTFTDSTPDSTSWTVTLDTAPLEGSLLVAALGFQGSVDGTDLSVQSPFTLILAPGNSSMGAAAAARFAGASEGSSVTFNMGSGDTSGSTSIVCMEFTGDFNAASVSDGFGVRQVLSSGTAFTSGACPPIGIGTVAHLVVPLLSMNGAATGPSIDLGHNFVAHARPGSQTWQRTMSTAWREVIDDATHAPTWSWTTGQNVITTGQVAFPLVAAEPLDTPTNFTFTAHGSLRQLNGAWDAVPNAATYEAQVDQETSPGTWTNLTTYSGAATSFQLTDADGVDWATTYRSRVRAHPAE